MNPRNYIVKVFLEHFSFGLIIPISIVWQLSQGLTLVEVGLIQAVVMVATFLLEVPTGVVADKYGRKTSIMSGTLAHTISLILLAFGSNFWMFLLSSVFAGLGWSLISGAGEALVYDSLKLKNLEHTFKKYLSHVMIADESSTLLGMVLSSVIVSVINIQTAIGIAAGVMAITLLYGILSLKEVHLKETNAQKNLRRLKKLLSLTFAKYQIF
jgi:MFS family permease